MPQLDIEPTIRPSSSTSKHLASLERLVQAVERASHLLPAQGPITVFIHHNTLHAFEELPFHEAVRRGSEIFGCQPYLAEDAFREALGRGRIRFSELREVLQQDLGQSADFVVSRLGTRFDLRLAMLQQPLRDGTSEELRWFVEETDALKRVRPEASAVVRSRLIAETRRWVMREFRSHHEAMNNGHSSQHRPVVPRWLPSLFQCFSEASMETWGDHSWEAFTLRALWEICRDGVQHAQPESPLALPIRHRDLLLLAGADDTDAWVHDTLIPFCGAFLDQGFSHWPLPNREAGFYHAFLALNGQRAGPLDGWLHGLREELRRLADAGVQPLECLFQSLEQLGVPESEWEDYLSASLLALRGWSGMVRQVEIRGDRVGHPIPDGSLTEFLAIRLLLERFALAHAARQHLGFDAPLRSLRKVASARIQTTHARGLEQRAFSVFQLAQLLGWTAEELHHSSADEWATLVHEIEVFCSIERRRIFQLAFERRLRTQALDALLLHVVPPVSRKTPRFQAIFCLDEREESFRRHLEEIASDVETFAAAGFFSIAMYFRGAADAHFVPLCPVVIRPKHWVAEQVDEDHAETHRRRAKTRQTLGAASHGFHVGSRSSLLGALLTAGFGVLASIPLVARILFPHVTARVKRRLSHYVQTPPKTRLKIERDAGNAGCGNGQHGFSLEEMTVNAERLLRDIGLVSGFSRLVLILGHGSNSLNNPHKSAYDCGACGGSAGGPNARALAHKLNDPRVRSRLAQRGIEVPLDTLFVGGFHNTCNDSVTFFECDGIPESHRGEFAVARREIDETCSRNAHERCRRFYSAPTTLSFEQARRHVEERSEDLAQTRPELGHATNALCIVGRRSRTRGLFLDRRAFLTSYDPTQDDRDSTILTRILQAAIPVCAGINLEYYFSRVDSAGWGCGSKLPHNITSLLGVMDGAASDLRTGLPWQMAEIHEPVRLLFIIEATPDVLLRIMDRDASIGKLCRNRWIQLAVLDPDSARIQLFDDGKFHDHQPQGSHLPTAVSSVDWYRGSRDHLEFAEITG